MSQTSATSVSRLTLSITRPLMGDYSTRQVRRRAPVATLGPSLVTWGQVWRVEALAASTVAPVVLPCSTTKVTRITTRVRAVCMELLRWVVSSRLLLPPRLASRLVVSSSCLTRQPPLSSTLVARRHMVLLTDSIRRAELLAVLVAAAVKKISTSQERSKI